MKHDRPWNASAKRSLALTLLYMAFAGLEATAQNGWTTPRMLNPNMPQTTPLMVVGPNNELIIACAEGPDSSQTSGAIRIYRSTNRGRDFVRTSVPRPIGRVFGIEGPRGLCTDGSGSIFLMWLWQEGDPDYYSQHLVMSKSSDGGVTFVTVWQNHQRIFALRNNPIHVDASNNIHLLWDSTRRNSADFCVLYTRFVAGSPSNPITRAAPLPDTLWKKRYSAMLVSGDTVQYAIDSPSMRFGDTSRCYSACSFDAGVSFSALVLIDIFAGIPQLVRAHEGSGVLYARRISPSAHPTNIA